MSNKEKWLQLCDVESTIPIFMHGWWMDIVCGKDNWDIALSYSNKGTIVGALNYFKKQKWGMSILTVPSFTPFGGIWYRKIETDKIQSFNSTRKRIMNNIIDQIPSCSMMDIKLHYSNDNWLPFKWKGYQATVAYTHTIDLGISLDEIWGNFKGTTRSKIQKNRDLIDIDDEVNLADVIPFIQSLFEFKKIGNGAQLVKLLKQLDQKLASNAQRKIWVARNKQGEIEAYLYLIWDKQSAYYLTGGTHPNNRKSNAMYALFWEAIQYSKSIVNIFDFEGSIIPNIEQVFKSFGASSRPYFKISKSSSKLIKIARIIMNKND